MKGTLGLVAKLPGPLKVLAVVAGVAVAVKAVNDVIEEHKRIASLGFGVSEESAKKLGLSYKTAGNQIEEYRKKKELADAANATKLYSTSKLEGPGMNITGPELKKLKKQTATDFPDEIKMLNDLDNNQVAARITSMKAGYVGLGMSVEEANELIYALLLNSNKSSQALALLGDEGFSRISDKASAASAAMKTFADALKTEDFDQIGIAFQTGVNVLDSYVNSLVGTDAKTKEVTTSAEAYKKVLDELNNRPAGNLSIGQEGYDSIIKSDAVMGRYISKTDTLAGAWAKVRLSTSGLNLDLKNMASDTAEVLSIIFAAQAEAFASVDGPFASLAKKIAALSKNTQESVIKSANKTKEGLQAEIKLRQKNIEKIKSEADARKKALDEELASQDFLTQLKKKQMEYSEALASGDMATAAQVQLDIQSLTGSRQVELAKGAIDKKADADVKKQQIAIDKLADAIDALGKSTDKQLAGVEKSQQEAAKYQLLMDRLVTLANSIQDGTSAEEDRAAKVLSQDLIAAGFSDIANKYLTKTVNPSDPLFMAPNYNSLKSLASDKFKFEAGKLTVTDVETRDAIRALELSLKPTALPKIDLVVKGTTGTVKTSEGMVTSAPGQKWVNANVIEYDLKKAGQKFAAGTRFTDKSGQSYIIDQVYSTAEGLDPSMAVISKYNMAAGGAIKNFMPGGNVTGPGTGTSDSIPAMLSNGEYVIKAASVKKYGINTFDALNAGRFADGGPINTSALITPSIPYYMNMGGKIPGYDKGGLVPGTGMYSGSMFIPPKYKNDSNTPTTSPYGPYVPTAPAARQNWFQTYVANLTKNKENTPAWARDPLGVQALLRKIAGQSIEGDSFAAAMLPLNFMGAGIPGRLGLLGHATVAGSAGARVAAGASKAVKPIFSKMTPSLGLTGSSTLAGRLPEQAALHAAGELVDPIYAGKVIQDTIHSGILSAARSRGARVPDVGTIYAADEFADESVNLMTAGILVKSDLGVSLRSMWGAAYDEMVKMGSKSIDGISKRDFFLRLHRSSPGVMSRYDDEPASQFVKEANLALLQSLGLRSDQAIAMYRSDPAPSGKSVPGYYSLSERFAHEYGRQYTEAGGMRSFDPRTGGLYQVNIDAADFPTPIGMGGVADEYATVLGEKATAGAKRVASAKLSGAWVRGFPFHEYYEGLTIKNFSSVRDKINKEAPSLLEKYPQLTRTHIQNILTKDEILDQATLDFSRLQLVYDNALNYRPMGPDRQEPLDQLIKLLEDLGKIIGQPLIAPRFAMGGLVSGYKDGGILSGIGSLFKNAAPKLSMGGMIPKFHKGGQVHKHKGASKMEQTMHEYKYGVRGPNDKWVPEIAGHGGSWVTPEESAAADKFVKNTIFETTGIPSAKRFVTGKSDPIGESFLPDWYAKYLGTMLDGLGSLPVAGALFKIPKYAKIFAQAGRIGQVGATTAAAQKSIGHINLTEDMMDLAISQQKSMPFRVPFIKAGDEHSAEMADIIARIAASAGTSKNSIVASLGYQGKYPLPKVFARPPEGGVRGWYQPWNRELQAPSGNLDTTTLFHEMFHDSQALTGVSRVPFLQGLMKSGFADESTGYFKEAFKDLPAFQKFLKTNPQLINRYDGYQEGQAEVAVDLITQHFRKNFDPLITPSLGDVKNPNSGFGTGFLESSGSSGYLFPGKYSFADLLQNKAVGSKFADPNFMEGLVDAAKSILTKDSLTTYQKRIALANKYGISYNSFSGKLSGDLDGAIAEAIKLKLKNGGMVDIPKFEKGINMVPANMLAMLHKNEAVIPANMNPFNPNAQSYSQPSVSYNIAPVINAAPGMDEQAIANMATRQVLAEIKVLDARNNASMGRPGMRVVGK
jgi:hypothetical protein